ncbi:MAG TPA: hypothetical protein DF383_05430 [Deltaproteobacteria bacterium]|nr:hypothetical protein [Deltaproteobacteria bacterium]
MTFFAQKSFGKTLLTAAIALVWLVNGLFCKLLNLLPRHEMIVARILGDSHAVLITRIIGLLEILMALWVLSGIKARYCALIQILIVAAMNVLELLLAPDLLLFGHFNSVIAAFFIGLIFVNEWKRSPRGHS